ncbi:hypothetical protein [Joostella sp. CR20]|uniref:hypothetical protein n=1 Tax=Joostella sp. CR20 TaxID=2804312 RepID=UPI00313D61F7
MSSYSGNNNEQNYFVLLIIVLASLLVLCSCKSKKVDKSYNKQIDKSEFKAEIEYGQNLQELKTSNTYEFVYEPIDHEKPSVIGNDTTYNVKVTKRKIRQVEQTNNIDTTKIKIDEKKDVKIVEKERQVEKKPTTIGTFKVLLGIALFLISAYLIYYLYTNRTNILNKLKNWLKTR